MKNFNVYQVRKKIRDIKKLAPDDEASHSAEDRLWENVLEAIAKGHPQSKELATVALTTRKIKFSRWCA